MILPYKYSKASNDFNPIHIDEDTAKKAGLSGIIVHGLCTMAMTMEKLISMNISDDASKLVNFIKIFKPRLSGRQINCKKLLILMKNKFNLKLKINPILKLLKMIFEVIG